MFINEFIYRPAAPQPRFVYVADSADGDSLLRDFVDEICPEADANVFATAGPIKMKPDFESPANLTIHTLDDGRPVWVWKFPIEPQTGRPFFMLIVENPIAE